NGLHDSVKVSLSSTPVGPLLIGVHEKAILFLHFTQMERLAKQVMRLQQQAGKPFRHATHQLHEQLAAELEEYFAGKRQTFSLPLKPVGTRFQMRVWQGLQKIPYGTTLSYEQLAIEIGQPTASRAVGLANGANPLSILIPCHRVVNKNGQLGGYGGGIWRKQILLDVEKPKV
ncbi:MAG TPA: methylated-DNA--[protein]-cysteine S-methyltransferase, partial [Gemmatales bacterium]|nr:methylated-DNA--[protein]-cysteine S-methyltransferase [Gemmatales bacterium]